MKKDVPIIIVILAVALGIVLGLTQSGDRRNA